MDMTSRERIALALAHKQADRVAIHDAPWATTVERWHREGLPEGLTPHAHFGYEFSGAGVDLSLRLPTETVEESDEFTILRDANGATQRTWKHATSTPELIDFAIKSPSDWHALKPRFAYDEARLNLAAARNALDYSRAKGLFFRFGVGAIGYDFAARALLGPVRLLTAIVEEPDWARDIFMTQAELCAQCVEELFARGIDFDGAFLPDDLGYRNGLLFSPRAYREVLQPAHRRYLEPFKRRGLPVILHSCGCVKELIPDLLDTGFGCLQPLEVKAGMDLIELKEKYGDVLAFMGGIDVRLMALDDPGPIEREIRTKIGVAKQGGGYIYHSDHSVPDDVSFAAYTRVIDLVHKYGSYY
jgi:uroporphyrinogen decarboxylase